MITESKACKTSSSKKNAEEFASKKKYQQSSSTSEEARASKSSLKFKDTSKGTSTKTKTSGSGGKGKKVCKKIMSESSEEVDNEETYLVDAIRAKRYRYMIVDTENKKGGKPEKTRVLQYFIKWVGYPEKDNTWEPADHLRCYDIISEFEEKCAQEKYERRLLKSGPSSTTQKRKRSSISSNSENLFSETEKCSSYSQKSVTITISDSSEPEDDEQVDVVKIAKIEVDEELVSPKSDSGVTDISEPETENNAGEKDLLIPPIEAFSVIEVAAAIKEVHVEKMVEKTNDVSQDDQEKSISTNKNANKSDDEAKVKTIPSKGTAEAEEPAEMHVGEGELEVQIAPEVVLRVNDDWVEQGFINPKIIGACRDPINNTFSFLVSFQDRPFAEIVESEICNRVCPLEVIRYYEQHLHWQESNRTIAVRG